MNPTFISRMLQSLAESTSGFSTGRRSPEAAGGTCVHSLRSSLLKQEEDEDDGEKALALSGQRKQGVGWGKGDCFCWHLATEVKQQASICLQNLHFSSTKFSFQSPDRKRCVRACVRLRVATSRGAELDGDTRAWQAPRLPARDSAPRPSPLRLPTTGENLERETCLVVRWVFAKSCLSACRRSTDNNLGTFFILYLNLDLFCLNQKQILK